jgi:hypothetical protein
VHIGQGVVVAELVADAELGPPPHIHRNADESFYILGKPARAIVMQSHGIDVP